MNNDIGKQFREFQKKVEAVLKRLPRLAASEAQNFFLDSFKRQAWFGDNTEPWAKRKPGAKRNRGRAILTDTGRLKRSIRIKQADWQAVKIGSDVPYAGVHNNGFRGGQQVPEHSRIASRKASKRFKGARGRIKGASHQVRAHRRSQNIPRRRFMGNSPYLNRRIDRVFTKELSKLK